LGVVHAQAAAHTQSRKFCPIPRKTVFNVKKIRKTFDILSALDQAGEYGATGPNHHKNRRRMAMSPVLSPAGILFP